MAYTPEHIERALNQVDSDQLSNIIREAVASLAGGHSTFWSTLGAAALGLGAKALFDMVRKALVLPCFCYIMLSISLKQGCVDSIVTHLPLIANIVALYWSLCEERRNFKHG